MKSPYPAVALLVALVSAAIHPPSLNITALTSRDGYSVLQCWQLCSLPVEAMSAANFEIGNTTRATWSVIPPRKTVGEAWALAAQLSVILNGMIRITSPAPLWNQSVSSAPLLSPAANSTAAPTQSQVAYIMPGTLSSSVLIAADTRATSYVAGHYTEFPSDEPTVLVQVRFEGGRVPGHVVLYDGACQ